MSRKKGTNAYISGSGNRSYIQLKNTKRMQLFGKENQPIVGELIYDEFSLELGWTGIINKDKTVQRVQGPDGVQYDLISRSHTSTDQRLSRRGGGIR